MMEPSSSSASPPSSPLLLGTSFRGVREDIRLSTPSAAAGAPTDPLSTARLTHADPLGQTQPRHLIFITSALPKLRESRHATTSTKHTPLRHRRLSSMSASILFIPPRSRTSISSRRLGIVPIGPRRLASSLLRYHTGSAFLNRRARPNSLFYVRDHAYSVCRDSSPDPAAQAAALNVCRERMHRPTLTFPGVPSTRSVTCPLRDLGRGPVLRSTVAGYSCRSGRWITSSSLANTPLCLVLESRSSYLSRLRFDKFDLDNKPHFRSTT